MNEEWYMKWSLALSPLTHTLQSSLFSKQGQVIMIWMSPFLLFLRFVMVLSEGCYMRFVFKMPQNVKQRLLFSLLFRTRSGKIVYGQGLGSEPRVSFYKKKQVTRILLFSDADQIKGLWAFKYYGIHENYDGILNGSLDCYNIPGL